MRGGARVLVVNNVVGGDIVVVLVPADEPVISEGRLRTQSKTA